MGPGEIIDTLLDRSIALGYAQVGLNIRRRLPGWADELPRMDGRVVVITGAAGGIGLACAEGFARLGAAVRPVGRDERRAQLAATQIRGSVPGADVRPYGCDLSSLEAIHALAERLSSEEERLDVLVNNAGVMPSRRQRSADGHELMFATHVLAPFALTELLSDLMSRSAPSRVINVSSGGMYSQALPGSDLQSDEARYSPKKLYARTKREQVVITEEWADRLRGSGIVVHAMHPGWVDTQGVRDALPLFRVVVGPIIRSPEEGADTIVWLGSANEPLQSTGLFWHDRRPRPTHYLLGPSEETDTDRERLWQYCSALLETAGITRPLPVA
jgi:dehydrogenase/reductase SDR family member 12